MLAGELTKLGKNMKSFLASAFAALGIAATASAQDDWRTEAVAALPQVGEMHLQLINNEAADGFMRLGWARDDENGMIQFYDRTMLASEEIYETMGGSIHADTLAPIDVAIRFHQQSAILSVEASDQDGVMVGGRTLTRPFAGQQSAEINTPITDGMVMRTAMFFLAQTLPLEAGDSIGFDWFSSLAGSPGTVTITAFEGGRIDTIGGSFDTLRLELRGGTPENDIYVTNNDGLRQVVRIDVIGQPMRFEAFPAEAVAAE